MDGDAAYEALTVETLPRRLGAVPSVAARLGDPGAWSVREVGDGNLNLVFVVEGPDGALVVKQALPYVRLVGESWPLPLSRAWFEREALARQAARDPGRVPGVVHFDRAQALIAMEYLAPPYRILRGKLIDGERVEGLGEALGRFCARTAFRGSDLAMQAAEKKADHALFLGNAALCDITEQLVFTEPFFDAPMNRHTPELWQAVARIRADDALKDAAQRMLLRFAAGGETLCHGDLHTGSVMCTDSDVRVIDPEFAFYGPMGFDLGMLLANYLMAFFSQPAHRGDPAPMQAWLLDTVAETCAAFRTEFGALWAAERRGILHPESLAPGASAFGAMLAHVWVDAIGVCGCEMHRRCLSLAHNADFEAIADTALRARLEARNLAMGRILLLEGCDGADALVAMARRFNAEDAA